MKSISFVIVLVTLFKAGGSYIVNPDINAAKTIIDMFSKSVVTFCLGNIESFIINFAILRKLFRLLPSIPLRGGNRWQPWLPL